MKPPPVKRHRFPAAVIRQAVGIDYPLNLLDIEEPRAPRRIDAG